MSEYVPTMVRLCSEYVEMRAQHYGFSDLYAEEWDRAIAAHDREVEVRTLRVAASEWHGSTHGPRRWLLDRADRLESQERLTKGTNDE